MGSKRGTYRALDDTLIRGEVSTYKTQCGNCKRSTVVINVHGVTLPAGIKPSNKLIAYGAPSASDQSMPHHFLGIGCGCYATFHRQIAHIMDKKK